MKILLSFLLLLTATFGHGVDEPLPDFEFELSCLRFANPSERTELIHVVIKYIGASNTCEATKGQHVQFSNGYDIDFKCAKPIPLSLSKTHPLQAWVLTAQEGSDKDQINKLALVVDHVDKTAAGFATAPNDIGFQVTCKKW